MTVPAFNSRPVPFAAIRSLAERCDLFLAGAVDRASADAALSAARPHLSEWQKSGKAGEMGYMQRPAELLSRIDTVLPDAKSVLIFLVPYRSDAAESASHEAGVGMVARYAWGRDYHRVLKKKLQTFNSLAGEVLGVRHPVHARMFSDAVPLLERSLAQAAGLGFPGKNTLLIRPGIGSFTFICELVWNISVELSTAEPLSAPGSGCGSCSRCLTSCPTEALSVPGGLDARRCISYLTIEKRTAFTEWEAHAIGGWVFGCDICQEVCPFNHRGRDVAVPHEFQPEDGSGRSLSLVGLLSLRDDDAFRRRFQGTALMRAGRSCLLRNACAVVANTGFTAGAPILGEASELDPSPLVRAEAKRSLLRLMPMLDGAELRAAARATKGGKEMLENTAENMLI